MLNDLDDREVVTEYTVGIIKKAAEEVYREVSIGQSGSVYESCLRKELSLQNIPYVRITNLPFYYKGERLDDVYTSGFFLIVNNAVLVELNNFDALDEYGQDTKMTNMVQVGLTTSVIIDFCVMDPDKLIKRIDMI